MGAARITHSSGLIVLRATARIPSMEGAAIIDQMTLGPKVMAGRASDRLF